MKRLLTAAVAVPLSLLAIFRLPPVGFFLICVLTLGWAAVEFTQIARIWAPGAPLFLLPPLAVGLAALLAFPTLPGPLDGTLVAAVAVAFMVGLGCLILLSRTPIPEAPAALGALAFGIPYFALPIASLVQLQRRDPWLVFLLIAIVWLGDTAAYYVGSAWGKHRFAPVVSPKKSWEGAIASFATGIAATIVWSYVFLERCDPWLLLIGAVTAVVAQLGDLVESIFKRSAGVKDSGNILPGHGGALDRGDALLLAAPVMWLGWLLVGHRIALP